MATTKTELNSKEGWAEYLEKNRLFAQSLTQSGKTYIDLTDIEFKNTLADLSQESLSSMILSMRSSASFYKKILLEPCYVEHPEKKNTHRYEDALKKFNSVNTKGRIIKSLIKP